MADIGCITMAGATLYNVDCMELMKTLPNKHFDLAIVDPPYGIGKDWKKRNKGAVFAETTYDNSTPPIWNTSTN